MKFIAMVEKSKDPDKISETLRRERESVISI